MLDSVPVASCWAYRFQLNQPCWVARLAGGVFHYRGAAENPRVKGVLC
jgi:hypothetical protein